MTSDSRSFPFLASDSACARLVAEVDWTATPLGPIEGWPASLTATVANMLRTRQPMLLFWGPDLIQFYNDAFVPSFGRGKHPAALGQRARDCWADAWPVVGAQIETVMSAGEPAWHENALVPIERNGRMEEVFWTYSYSPAHDDHGRVYGTLVIVTEMTPRVLSGRRLEALATFGFALSGATSYAAVFDAVAALAERQPADLPFIVICDRGAPAIIERCVGISRDAAVEIAAAAVASAPPRGLHDVSLDRGPVGSVWPEPVSTFTVAGLGTSGHVISFGLSPRLPIDHGYRAYIEQIVEQATSALVRIDSASASLAVQRQRDALLMKAPVGTALLTGPRHIYQLANPLYCRMVGRDPVGLAYVDAFPEVRDTELPRILDRVYETGVPFAVSEMHVPLDPGRTGTIEDCYFTFNLEPLRDEAKQVYGMMAVAVDITEQVRARHTLEKIGEERDRVMVALEQANRTKDEFLAMLGHELRNPLAPIVTALELMNLKDSSAKFTTERAVIERQLKHVVRLVDDLLDISRITRGALVLEKHPVNIKVVIDAAIETVSTLLSQRHHHLVADVASDVIVSGDESRLVQVFSNLLTNAARYTSTGGEIRVSARVRGTVVAIDVSDNGRGIAPDLLPHIFDSFVQGTRSADRAEGGLGLGLAIVQNLVALHGGSVSAHSDGPGRGSSFGVELPLSASTSDGLSSASVDRTAAAARRRVLLVDDNADAADMLGELVRRRGHDVTVAHDPESALAVIAEFRPDIALLDLGLPRMDGYQLAARIRVCAPECRLIALTGYGLEGDLARTSSAGFVAHLVKPVETETLLAMLAST